MKTAKEWSKESGPIGIMPIELIKQVQLDAWKQGMTDAANTVDAWTGEDAAAIKRAIEIIRECKTTL